MKQHWIITAVLIALVGAAAFYGGMRYQQMQRNTAFGASARGGQFRQFGAGNGANVQPVRGQILNADENSITVKSQDGSSKIVLLSKNTMIVQSASASASDLQTGKQVMVIGSSNSDGSITAQNVQINPQMR